MEEEQRKHKVEDEQRKEEEVEEEQRKKQEEEEWVAIIAKAVGNAHCCHVEKEWMKQLEMMRKKELWGKTGGEARGEAGGKAGGGSRMWRCDYCTKKNTACHWPSMGSKACSCSQCREHKVTWVVGGEGNEKRKEQGSPGEGSPEEDQDGGDGCTEFSFKRCNSGGTRYQPATHS